uniref:Uncharacterized protein n=1 Tax=Photinus pyralis TaxID=7054 RepID=A0A1Y1M512_PHOPY
MSFKERRNVTRMQSKLKYQLDELEDSIKYEWNTLTLDKSVKNLIEDHQTEIIHHLDQMRHHLERLGHHKKRLDDIEVEQKKAEAGELAEEKLRLKLRRVSKTSSLKYVLQWENILEQQNNAGVLNSVNFRNQRSSDEFPVTHAMVRSRIEEFEGIRKPKRASSTVETFLEFGGESPRRIKSYSIIEDAEGEVEDKGDSSQSNLQNGDSNQSSKPRIVQIHYKQPRQSEGECLSNSL